MVEEERGVDGEKKPRKMIWLGCAPLVSGSQMSTEDGWLPAGGCERRGASLQVVSVSCRGHELYCVPFEAVQSPRPLHGLPLWTAPAPPPPEECPETEPSWKDRPTDPDQHLAEGVPLQPPVSTPMPRSLRVHSSLCYKIRQSCGELLTIRLDSAEETGQRPQTLAYFLGFPMSAH